MKNILFIYLYLLFINTIHAQGYDNIWIFGGTGITANKQGGNLLNFANNPVSIDTQKLPIRVYITLSTISDSLGALLFYTNGVKIINRNHEVMENGDSLSDCDFTYAYNMYNIGQPTPNGSVVIPHPKQPNIYYLFHYNYVGAFEPPQNPFNGCSHLLCTTIDMSYNNGLGKVIEKNLPIISSPLTWGCIQAVKHANGHDWWLIVPEYTTRYYHRVLIDGTGVHYEGKQLAGPNITIPGDWDPSLAKFSQQGDKYVRFRPPYEAYYFHFDRCTGLLSDVQTIPLDLTYTTGDIEFSPDGNLLYVSNVDTIFQLDLNASNIASSKTVVAVYDGFQSPFGSIFNLAKLAPDGKIYLSCGNGETVLHVIENPNILGIGCNVLQHNLHLPNGGAAVPSYPNYHLGAMLCDTTTAINEEGIRKEVSVYPNPTNSSLTVSLPISQEKYEVLVFNPLGEKVMSYIIQENTTLAHLPTENLVEGVYYLQLLQKNNVIFSQKIVIQK